MMKRALIICACLLMVCGCSLRTDNPNPPTTTATTTPTTTKEPEIQRYTFTNESVDKIDSMFNTSKYRELYAQQNDYTTTRSIYGGILIQIQNTRSTYYDMVFYFNTDTDQNDQPLSTVYASVVYKMEKKLVYERNGVYKEAYFTFRGDSNDDYQNYIALYCEQGIFQGRFDLTNRMLHPDPMNSDDKRVVAEINKALYKEVITMRASEEATQMLETANELRQYLQDNIISIPAKNNIEEYTADISKHIVTPVKEVTYNKDALFDGSNSQQLMLPQKFESYSTILNTYFKHAIGATNEFASLEEFAYTPYVVAGLLTTLPQQSFQGSFIGRNGETISIPNTTDGYFYSYDEEDLYALENALLQKSNPILGDTSLYRYHKPYIITNGVDGDYDERYSRTRVGPNFHITDILEENNQLRLIGYKYLRRKYVIIGKDDAALYQDPLQEIDAFVKANAKYLDRWEYILQKNSDDTYTLVSGLKLE